MTTLNQKHELFKQDLAVMRQEEDEIRTMEMLLDARWDGRWGCFVKKVPHSDALRFTVTHYFNRQGQRIPNPNL